MDTSICLPYNLMHHATSPRRFSRAGGGQISMGFLFLIALAAAQAATSEPPPGQGSHAVPTVVRKEYDMPVVRLQFRSERQLQTLAESVSGVLRISGGR